MIRSILATLALALALAGCGVAQTATRTFDPAGAQKAVFALKSGYAAGLRLAVAYNERPRCGQPTSPKLCSDAAVVAQMRKADNATFAAIDTAETAARTLKDSTVLGTAITAAQASLDAYKKVIAVYAPEAK